MKKYCIRCKAKTDRFNRLVGVGACKPCAKRYRADNKHIVNDSVNRANCKYRANNAAERAAKQREYYQLNKEEITAKLRAKRAAEKDK